MSKTILVVDDEPDIRQSVKQILQVNGYTVETAVDGDDCLQKLKELTPDLILLDIMMPGTPVKEILPKVKNIKIIYVTVVRIIEAEKQGLLGQRNIVGFIQKPFDINGLLKEVKKIID